METISSKGPLKGEITIPGDKSMTHRAIMLASLATGKTVISHPLLGEDCMRTAKIFQTLGVQITFSENKIEINSPGYAKFNTPHQVLYTGNSGTTTRLMSGLLGGLGLETVLSGDESIGKRPMNRVIKPLQKMGVNIQGVENNYTPLIINRGHVQGINYKMPVASAQVKSALLFAGLFAPNPTIIEEINISRNHTETMFEHFGIPIEVSEQSIILPGQAIQYLVPHHFDVPGDISSAAFFIVAALITPGSDIYIHNVGMNKTRDGIIEVVQKMGGRIEILNLTDASEPTATLHVQYTDNLKPVEISGQIIPRCIDELPVIALLCTQATGSSIIKDAEELKVKETNRIDTTVNELNRLGFQLEPTDEGMIIHPSTLLTPKVVDSHTDHRIGMMLAIASLLTDQDIQIQRFDSVNVSFPGFLPILKQLENEG